MTKFDDAFYHWDRDPADGEYEFQFDRFESTGDYHDQAVFIIVDTESDEVIGDVMLSTADVPDLDSDDSATTRIYHGTVEDSEVVDMTHNQELSEQRYEKAQKEFDRLLSDTDDENETED